MSLILFTVSPKLTYADKGYIQNKDRALHEINQSLEKATLLLNKNDKSAVSHARKALDLVIRHNEISLLGEAELVYAKSQILNNSYQSALDHSLKASQIFYKSKGHDQYAESEKTAGEAYIGLNNFKEAIKNFTNAFNVFLDEKNEIKGAYVAISMGKCYQHLNDHQNVIVWFNKAKNIFFHRQKIISGIKVANLLATEFNNYGDYNSAILVFNESLKEAESNNLNDEVEKIKSKLSIVEANIQNESKSKTKYKVDKKNQIQGQLTDMKQTYVKSLAEIETLSKEKQLVEFKIKAQQDDYEKKILHERIKNIKINNQLNNEKLENEKINLELNNEKLLVQKSKIEKHRLVIFITALFIVLLLLVYGFFNHRKNNKKLRVKNELITKQKEEIEHKNNSIEESINYAQRIQNAILSSKENLKSYFPDSFVYLNPKDKVSGDFFWCENLKDQSVICAADCTGHGVPGAFMSIFISNILDHVVKIRGITNPKLILEETEKVISEKINDTNNNVESFRDGMDAAIIQIDRVNDKLNYCGAKNPVYIIREGELIELSPTKRSVEINRRFIPPNYELIQFDLLINDTIYMFSDGFPDQKGGEENLKFYYPYFKKYLTKISVQDINLQSSLLEEKYNTWKNSNEQIDDVLLLGIKYI